jgi:Pyridoxamine 5'-phosphate oxidase
VCVTVTLTDGLVLARSVFEHTINYRSAMIYGQPRQVTDPAERLAGLRCITEHVATCQWGPRPPAQPQGTRGGPPAGAPDGPQYCSGHPVSRYDPDDLHRELGPQWMLVAQAREEHMTPDAVIQPFTWAAFRRQVT